METGITQTALHASLIQVDDQTGKRVSCAFYSRNIAPIEVDYSPLEMKILPIRAAFMVWCRYLENTEEPIMILLNTEDLTSLNNDRLTVLLPGHWVFFFSHFNFEVMERPEQDGGRPLPPVRNPGRRAFQARTATRPRRLFNSGGSPGDQLPESGEEEETEDAPPQEESSGQTLRQKFLAWVPVDQILSNLLAHLSVAQIRAVILHFFRGLLFWKNTLAVAALLVMMRVKQRLPLFPAPALAVARLPARRSPRLVLDSSLLANHGIATAVTRMLTQMPPFVGTDAVPATPGALLPWASRALRFPPEFWMMLRERFSVRVSPGEGPQPLLLGSHHLELHVVGRDVVLREALQDDLQRFRQCGLHDGLQDTSQDAQEDDVQEDDVPEDDVPEDDVPEDEVPGDQAQGNNVPGDNAQGDQVQDAPGADPSPAIPNQQEAPVGILSFLHSHLRAAQEQPNRAQQDPAARSLAHFLAMICAEAPVPIRGRQPRERARLEELPEDDEDPGQN